MNGFVEDGFAEDGFAEAKEKNLTNGFNECGDDGFDNCNPEFSTPSSTLEQPTQSRPAKTVQHNLNSDLLDLF